MTIGAPTKSAKVFALGVDLRWHIAERTYPAHADTVCGQIKLRCSRFQAQDEERLRRDPGEAFHPLCAGCWLAREQNANRSQ